MDLLERKKKNLVVHDPYFIFESNTSDLILDRRISECFPNTETTYWYTDKDITFFISQSLV
jgi:hypothetical protein